jgi:hypothetical protein
MVIDSDGDVAHEFYVVSLTARGNEVLEKLQFPDHNDDELR